MAVVSVRRIMSVASRVPKHQVGIQAVLKPLLRPALIVGVAIISLAALALMLKSVVRGPEKRAKG